MRSQPIPPFLMASPDRIVAQPWQTEERPLPEALDHWDASATVVVRRLVRVDLGGVCADTALGPASQFAISASAFTAQSRVLVASALFPIIEGEATVLMQFDGQNLSGDLALRSRLVVTSPDVVGSDVLSPTRGGAWLWEDSYSTRLEGSAARFPVTQVPFSSTLYAPGGMWSLEIGELEQPFLGGVRLWLNSDHPIAAAWADESHVVHTLVSGVLRYDTARALVMKGLTADPRELQASADETVGAAILELIGRCWPGRSLSAIRELPQEELMADLQEYAGVTL